MTPNGLKKWRELMGYSRQEAAEALELSLNAYSNYERGIRYESEGEHKDVEIPKTVELACAAVSIGIRKYNGEPLKYSKS